MAASIFKAGDRVEVVDAGSNGVKNGDKGVVVRVEASGFYDEHWHVYVKIDGRSIPVGLFQRRLKLIGCPPRASQRTRSCRTARARLFGSRSMTVAPSLSSLACGRAGRLCARSRKARRRTISSRF